MKRTLIVIMALCAALAFTACGKSSSNTETTPAPTTAEPETKEPATTQTEAESEEIPLF